VAETAPGLVYIEIKDTGVRDYFTGQPVTSSNGSGFIVTHINGKPIHGSRDVYKLLEGSEDLNFTVIRDQNKFHQITVRPESPQ